MPQSEHQFSIHQKAALNTHDGGEFAHCTTHAELNDCGDPLIAFIVRELDPDEDCNNLDDALRRMQSITAKAQGISEALELLQLESCDRGL